MSITSYDHHPTLRHEERDALGTALQAVLIDLIDLSLVAKQLHWNVTGPTFRELHLQLDELAQTFDRIRFATLPIGDESAPGTSLGDPGRRLSTA
jgi:hypothetical protein